MSLHARIERRFPACSDKQKDALVAYVELVRSFGKRMNLTAASSDADFDQILLSDADMLSRCVRATPLKDVSPLRCVDVGAGAGAPAIPFAILWPQASFTLVEPLRKRVTFLRSAIGSLGLAARISVVEQKLSWEAPTVAGMPFDLALSRATVAPEQWLAAGSMLAPRVAVFHSSDDHHHPRLAPECEERSTLPDGRSRYVGIFVRKVLHS